MTFATLLSHPEVIVAGYLFLVLTSGRIVTAALSWADDGYASHVTEQQRDVGTIVGKCENVLLLTFVLLDAFTALAIIFAAKSIVRREDMKNDSLFYLAGTLLNFTYSIGVGLVVRVLAEGLL